LQEQRAALDADLAAYFGRGPSLALELAGAGRADAATQAIVDRVAEQTRDIERTLDGCVQRSNEHMTSAMTLLAAGDTFAVMLLLGGFTWLRAEARERERVHRALAQSRDSTQHRFERGGSRARDRQPGAFAGYGRDRRRH
jgi:hypothetical protein